MVFVVVKYLVTAAVIVLVSEVAKRSDKLGALLISLPLMSIITLIWLYAEKQPEQKIANHASYTFWYVIPTLPMFILFPFFLKQFGFPLALAFCILITIALIVIFSLILQRFGINLP
jgi:hypothetical protein